MVKKLVAKVGTYEKDGQTKSEWLTVGVMLENDNGPYILLDPSVSISGALTRQNIAQHKAGKKVSARLMVSVFSEDDGDRRSGGQPPSGDMDDEIPF